MPPFGAPKAVPIQPSLVLTGKRLRQPTSRKAELLKNEIVISDCESDRDLASESFDQQPAKKRRTKAQVTADTAERAATLKETDQVVSVSAVRPSRQPLLTW